MFTKSAVNPLSKLLEILSGRHLYGYFYLYAVPVLLHLCLCETQLLV
jgi:hypothetical protein